METFYHDNHVKVYNKDCRDMPELEDNSIQCVVTSPPYWGLRKYAGEQELVWGGDNHHKHEWNLVPPRRNRFGKDVKDENSKEFTNKGSYVDIPSTNTCSLCGAWRGAFGLEPTPEMYVQHSIEILREIKRVLRKDGVVFWNIGDTYSGSGQGYGKHGATRGTTGIDKRPIDIIQSGFEKPVTSFKHSVLKPKDLCLIPFRVAIATQEDGWWIRSVIIWSKNHPMPESVTDRPTESHEYILMLTKSAKYYWDQEAVREPYMQSSWERGKYSTGYNDKMNIANEMVNTPQYKGDDSYKRMLELGGRNLRSVWTFPTEGYPEAHFATFPEKLPGLCIKAASKEGDIVLDPFAGAGTTLWVSKKLNRQAIGYEISTEYCELIRKRNLQQVGL